MNIIPIFSTHYSLGNSLLTLEEAGLTKPNNPYSICDIAREEKFKQVILVEDRIDGFLEAYKNLNKEFKPIEPKKIEDYISELLEKDPSLSEDKAKEKALLKLEEVNLKYEKQKDWLKEPIQLIYGIKLKVCDDINDKSEASLKNESNVIIFIKNTKGYNDLIRIWNKAWTDGFYYQGRIDWENLCKLWTNNLLLAMPFFSSFIARNTLTLSNIIPKFPCDIQKVFFFDEQDSGLPFEPVLKNALYQFVEEKGVNLQKTKSIYYKHKKDFRSFIVNKAIQERSAWDTTRVEHLSSDKFCLESFKELKNE